MSEYPGGFAIATLHCTDPATGEDRFIYSVSGSVEDARERCRLAATRLPANYVIADPVLDPAYWAGSRDPRFVRGRNADGTPFDGDSTTCAEPRVLQCARSRGWIVKAMTVGWYGSSPNPLPDTRNNRGGQYMRQCPSCEANVNALMDGVRT